MNNIDEVRCFWRGCPGSGNRHHPNSEDYHFVNPGKGISGYLSCFKMYNQEHWTYLKFS